MGRTGQPAIRQVAAVQRAVAVLDVLANGHTELGTNEIARRTGINPSTVSRLLATLVESGLVEHVAGSGRYRLGLRLIQLGNAALSRLDVRELARPHLLALSEATGETVTVSLPGEGEAVTVDYVQSPSLVQSVARIGRPSVPHATAVGKVLLAHLGTLPTGTLRSFTDRTITDPETLATEVALVRERGYARARGEREPDLNAVAAPILGAEGELAAILGVQGPASRFDDAAMDAGLPILLHHARAVSTALGYHTTPDHPDEEAR
ncbi:MAG: IclR family transcriptional regulator [Gaiellales bacterium]